MNRTPIISLILGSVLSLVTLASAQVPQMINYQGRVAVGDPAVNFDGTGEFKFALVNEDGSASYWSNDGTSTEGSEPTAAVSLMVTNGLYSVLLGDPCAGCLQVRLQWIGINTNVSLGYEWTGCGGTTLDSSSILGPNSVSTICIDCDTQITFNTTPFTITTAISTINQNGNVVYQGQTLEWQVVGVCGPEDTVAIMTAIPNSVFGNSDVHLRVWFDDGTNGSQLLTPDQRIAAVGYAMVASTVVDGAITSEKLASGLTLGGTTSGTFSGDGSGLTNIPASAIVSAPPPGMVLIPEGAFTMGNSVAADTDITDADPVSTTVSAFYMDVTEVTLSQWQVVQQWATLVGGYTALAAGSGKDGDHPVQTVNWYDCVTWCNARSEREGKTPVYYTDDAQTLVYKTGEVDVTNLQVKWSANGYRLPTEAEWEKAARGGLSGKRFPWGDTISQSLANYNGSTSLHDYDLGPDGFNWIGAVGGTLPATSPVGSFAANGYGLHDMAGNGYEWCWDWYGTPYAGGTDPHGAATGSDYVPVRVLRGGSWGSSAFFARCADRLSISTTFNNSDIGFRAVLAPGQ